MADNTLLKTARQMIDDLINDDPESAKTNFHDFLTAKTVAKLNPEMVAAQEEVDGESEEITDDDDPSIGSEDFSDDDSESESESEDDEVK